jgi:hypothetical protein
VKRAFLLVSLLALAACVEPARVDAANKQSPVEPKAEVKSAPEVASTKASAAVERQASTIRETDAALPTDLELRIEKNELVIERRANVISVLDGDVRTTAVDKLKVPLSADGPYVIEATDGKTLETARIVARVERADEARPKIVARLAESPKIVGGDKREAHDCLAHEDGGGGFAVVCRVETQANAGSITGEDAKAGVFESVGKTSYVRLDLDPREEAAVSKGVAYNSKGRGVIVRAEASLLSGEKAPTFVVLSEARDQPVVRPIRGCFRCRLLRPAPNPL